MPDTITASIIEHPFSNVKPLVNNNSTPPSNSLIHHKEGRSHNYIVLRYQDTVLPPTYGASIASRVLPVSLFRKKEVQIKQCLNVTVGLTKSQVEAAMRLLRLQAYYRFVYPSADQVCGRRKYEFGMRFEPFPGYVPPKRHHWGTSRASFWRAIKVLKDIGLIEVVNRYVLRPHAQISNLYRLDRLIMLLAKYLAERGEHGYPPELRPLLSLPWPDFWPTLRGRFFHIPPPMSGIAGMSPAR